MQTYWPTSSPAFAYPAPEGAALTDLQLIELTLAGQSEYFNILVNRHLSAVRRRLQAMVRDTSDQEDLAQETVIKSWRYLSTFRSDSSFRTWIVRIAINEAMQHYRRRKLRGNGTLLDGMAAGGDSPHDHCERVENRRRLHDAVAGLPEKYRQVLVLRDLKEMSIRDTARVLDSGIPLVKSRLLRARGMLSAAVQASGRF